MQDGLYVALSGQVALQKRLDTIAHNVANMNTAGFRADEVSFSTVLANTGDNSTAFASTGANYISRKFGSMSSTGNPLDIAVRGDGWFAVQTPAGTAYTRDGRMRMSDSGSLESLNGYPILDAGGAPILLSPNAGPPVISGDGMISQGGQASAAVGLFTIDDSARLERYDNSSVIPDKPATPVLDFSNSGVVQGYVEGANVNPIMEMSRMIAVTHAFEGVSTAIQSTENSLTDAIKTLGATS